MQTELWAISTAVLATAVAAAASLFLKWGAAETRFALRGFHVSRWTLGSLLLYILATLVFLLALLGAQLSILLPITALEYVWITLLARRFLQEPIGRAKLAGVALVILGVLLVGLGS